MRTVTAVAFAPFIFFVFFVSTSCLSSEAFAATEKWSAVTWDSSADARAGFEALCTARGMTSTEVLEANGFSGRELPPRGEEILVPMSRRDILSVWMEAQNRGKGLAKPLVTIDLHRARGSARDNPPVAQPTAAAATPAPRPVQVVVEPQPGESRPRASRARRSRAQAQAQANQGKMIWPVNGKVSSGFGRRGRGFHSGIDIPRPLGTPIVAAMDGVVLEIATTRDARYRGYGNTVVIDHGRGITTLYAHCSRLNVRKGQRVRRGEIIAFVGSTGQSTTNHLHFEVRRNGKAVDPIPFLPRL